MSKKETGCRKKTSRVLFLQKPKKTFSDADPEAVPATASADGRRTEVPSRSVTYRTALRTSPLRTTRNGSDGHVVQEW